MIKSLIIEDESYIRKGLSALIKSLDKDILIVGECESVKDAVVVANACQPDLVFLDINIIGGTGFDFLEQTKNLSYKVIFITAYEEFALKAFKNGALDYILKPVEVEELAIAIDKVMQSNLHAAQLNIAEAHFKGKKEKLVLRLQDSFQIINFDELKFCKSDGGYTYFYMSDGRSFLASKPIKEFESQLPSEIFIRTHQSFIVNLNYVDKYDKRGFILLKSGDKIDVSIRKKEAFISKLLK